MISVLFSNFSMLKKSWGEGGGGKQGLGGREGGGGGTSKICITLFFCFSF